MINILLFETVAFKYLMSSLYFLILTICFITSIVVFKYSKGLKVFPWLMGFTLGVETVTFIMSNIYVINPFGFYHFYLPLEGALLIFLFYNSIEEQAVKKILLYAAVLFVVSCLALTFFFYRLSDFPGLQANMIGLLLISISAYTLLSLNPIYNIPLYKHPMAWICIGIIVFYTGNFFLNGLYNYLIVTKSKSRLLIHSLINNGLNCFMYLSYILGLICSHRLKKYNPET